VKEEGGRGKGEGVPLSILLLGDAGRPEFRDVRACLGKWGIVVEFAGADSAVSAVAEDRILPDVMVVAQAFPGQFSHEAIDRLRRSAPLAQVVGLLGSWCEGETRSGLPWPAAARVYWHQWPARCDRQLRRLATGRSCSWALPLTATEEERLLADATESLCATAWNKQCRFGSTRSAPLVPSSGTLVAIHSSSHEMAAWLSAACRRRGFVTIWQCNAAFDVIEGASAGVFDGTDLGDEEYDRLCRFVRALRPAPVVALLSFPRIADHRRALAAGASAVLSKPLKIEDLLEPLDASTAVAAARP
jgi:CheY-like chemotaxis protein